MRLNSFLKVEPDGGVVFTDDDHLAQELKSIRVHGKGSHKYDNARIGINRPDGYHASVFDR